MLTLHQLDQPGKGFFQNKLAESINWTHLLPVATAIHNANLLSFGCCYSVADFDQDCDPSNFEASCGNGGQETQSMLLEWMWKFIQAAPTHFCLIDEQQSLVNDPIWQGDVLPTFHNAVRFSGGSIFYFVHSHTIQSKGLLSELIKTTFWYPFYCAFVANKSDSIDMLLREQDLPERVLSGLASHALGCVTDTYDLEGLLLWNRQQVSNLDNPFLGWQASQEGGSHQLHGSDEHLQR
jgi:hypothetical protein